MKYRLLSFSSILLVFSFLSAYSFTYSSYLEFFNSILNVQADKSEVYEVKNFAFEKGDAKFQMNSGYIVLGTPLEGRVRMAYFVGRGSFTFSPPIEVEKNQLRRYYEVDTIKDNVTSFFFICGDSMLYTMRSKLSRTTVSDLSPVIEGFHNAVGVAAIKHKLLIREDIENALLDNRITPFFFGVVGFKKGNFFAYIENPNDFEDITYSEIEWKAPIGGFSSLICSYQSPDRTTINADSLVFNDFKINKYEISSKIDGSDMQVACNISAKAEKSQFSWLAFNIFQHFIIDSVVDSKGASCPFYKVKDSYSLKIRINNLCNANDSFSIKLYYHGPFLTNYEGAHILDSYNGWYPTYWYKNKAIFDLTFENSDQVNVIAFCKKISEEKNNNKIITKFMSDGPVESAIFEIGHYEMRSSLDTNFIPVKISSDYFPPNDSRIAEICYAHRYFARLFGPIDSKELYGGSMKNLFLPASKGYINLSNYINTNHKTVEFYMTYLPQEVARQWWGVGIEYATYRDQWISYGFSTYCSLLFVQNVIQDEKRYNLFIDETRRHLVETRRSLIGNSVSIGALGLGGRNNGVATYDYDLVIYEKGAYILHMLRCMLMDLQSLEEDNFVKMLREFYATNKGKKVTTNDFKKITEKYFDADMSWFFDEWVDGYKTPKYIYGWKCEKTADNKYIVKIRIKQEEVDSTFMAQILMNLNFDDNKNYTFRALANGPFTEYTTPPLPLQPKKLEFNYLNSVLCDFEGDDYDDIK